MNKPDGITQDARIASALLTELTNAYDCWDEWGVFPDDFLKDLEEELEVAIAAAIKSAVEAERLRCASVAEDHHDDDGTGLECQGCGEVIAERIRSGK